MAEFNEELKLNDFQTEFFKRMNEVREENHFCDFDVTLDVDGTLFPCHRLVLISASPYFKTMFNGNFKESTSNVVPLREVEPEAMKQILNTFYTSRIQLRPENVYSVLRASHLLQLETIVDTCAKCIIKTPRIHYLIETCIFARSIARQDLYDACVRGIADNLLHWGRTDSFVQLSSVDLNAILQKGNYDSIKDEVLMLILRWSNSNPASTTPKGIQELLESAKLWNQMFGGTVLAQYMVTGESDLVKSFIKSVEDDEDHEDADFCFNLYVNTVDVKSGDKGWGVLKTNESFDKYSTLSNLSSTGNTIKAVCKVETSTHFLEEDYSGNYTLNSYDAYNEKTVLKIPTNCVARTWVSMTAIENTVYLVGNHYLNSTSRIWTRNNVPDEWVETSEIRSTGYYSFIYSNCIILTTLDKVLYIIGSEYTINRGCISDTSRKCILSFDSRSPKISRSIEYPSSYANGNYAACSFDGKIAISAADLQSDGVRRNTFSIYDVRANKFLIDIKQMNTNQVNRRLIHRNDIIYSVSNSLLEKDEKYLVNSNNWTEIPNSLPKRVKTTDGVATVATGSVFAVDNC